MSLPTIGSMLDATDSFNQGQSMVQQSINERLQRDEADQIRYFRERQINLQQQEAQAKAQEALALKQGAIQSYDKPEILQEIYGINPTFAKSVADFNQNRYQAAAQIGDLLLKTDAANKQFYYEGARDKLKALFPKLAPELGDKFSPELQKKLKREVDFVKANINTVYQLQETARGLENYNNMTGELGGAIARLKPIAPIAGEAAPSAVREYQYFQGLNPQQKNSYLNLKRNTIGEGTTFDEQGNVAPLEGYIPSKKDIETAKSLGKKQGELETERKFAAPKIYNSMQSSFAKNKNVSNTIDKIIPKISDSTAGLGGTILSKLPGTKAKNVERQIETVVASLGFKELQEMKDNSPTGGALGSVAIKEIEFLQSVVSSLKQDQSPEQLVENLKIAKQEIAASNRRTQEAYDREYGTGNFKVDNLKEQKINQNKSSNGIKFIGFE